jgi:sugar phosphate isomerase/epimerase
MDDFKYGLKLYSTDVTILPAAVNLVDLKLFHYIEVTRVPDTPVAPFAEHSIPYVIHGAITGWMTDFGNPDRKYENMKIMDDNISWANALNAKHIIIHPGEGWIDNVITFFKKINDNRIIFENMPKYGIHKEDMIGYSPGQIRQLQADRFGFCLDFSHAIKTALTLGKNIEQYIVEFMGNNPSMFHICDGRFDNLDDEHLPIGMGKFNFTLFKSMIMKTKYPRRITIETNHNQKTKLIDTIIDRLKFERRY